MMTMPWYVAAIVWVAICLIYDLRFRALPSWLTIPPLGFALLWATWRGQIVLVVFVLSLIAFDNLPADVLRLLVALQLVGLTAYGIASAPDMLPLTYAVFFIWLAWARNVLGGADAQVLLTLMFVFGAASLFPIVYLAGVQAIVQWARKKSTFPAMLAILAGFSAYTATLL